MHLTFTSSVLFWVAQEPRSEGKWERETAFTFPSDYPEKRIDYILSHTRDAGITVLETTVIGQETPNGEGAEMTQEEYDAADPNTRGQRRLGMLEKGSKLYASDHRGLLTVLRKNN